MRKTPEVLDSGDKAGPHHSASALCRRLGNVIQSYRFGFVLAGASEEKRVVVPQTLQGEISKDIVRGIAITTLVIALTAFIPVFVIFGFLLIPLTILFYRSKLGRRLGAVVPIASAMLMVFVLGGITSRTFIFFELLLIGFFLSEFIEADLSVEKTVLYTCGAVLLTGVAALVFYGNLSGVRVDELVSGHIGSSIDITIDLYKNIGTPESTIRSGNEISNKLEEARNLLIVITPALAAVLTLFIVFGTLLAAKPLMKNKHLHYPEFGPLNHWRAPESLVWGVIVCGLALLFSDNIVGLAAGNGLIVLMTFYFLGGIAIMSFYFEKKKFPTMLRFFLYCLIIVTRGAVFLVIGLGFLDIWMNFRKLEIDKNEE